MYKSFYLKNHAYDKTDTPDSASCKKPIIRSSVYRFFMSNLLENMIGLQNQMLLKWGGRRALNLHCAQVGKSLQQIDDEWFVVIQLLVPFDLFQPATDFINRLIQVFAHRIARHPQLLGNSTNRKASPLIVHRFYLVYHRPLLQLNLPRALHAGTLPGLITP